MFRLRFRAQGSKQQRIAKSRSALLDVPPERKNVRSMLPMSLGDAEVGVGFCAWDISEPAIFLNKVTFKSYATSILPSTTAATYKQGGVFFFVFLFVCFLLVIFLVFLDSWLLWLHWLFGFWLLGFYNVHIRISKDVVLSCLTGAISRFFGFPALGITRFTPKTLRIARAEDLVAKTSRVAKDAMKDTARETQLHQR